MGRFTFSCPITGEQQVFSNVAPGEEVSPFYSARATAEEIDAYEAAQRNQLSLLGEEFKPRWRRYPHQSTA